MKKESAEANADIRNSQTREIRNIKILPVKSESTKFIQSHSPEEKDFILMMPEQD